LELDSIYSGQGSKAVFCEHCNELSGSIKVGTNIYTNTSQHKLAG